MPHLPSLPARLEDQVAEVNASGLRPVVFIHGLWLLPSSWDRWAEVFAANGFAPLVTGWPDDPDTVEEARSHPEVLAGKTVGQVADHFAAVVGRLERKPVVIGHSMGALLTMILAGRGLAQASVAIDSAPFRGVLALPLSTIRAASPVLLNPLNRGRAVPLTFPQFRYAFANMVDEAQARDLYERYAVPAPGAPAFQAAAANLNPWTQARVDSRNPDRGPLLVVAGSHDTTSPEAVSRAVLRLQGRNPGVTELARIEGRGHSLTIDDGWREVCDTALAFARRFA